MTEQPLPCRGCNQEPFALTECGMLKCPTTDCAYSEMGARPFAEWQRIHEPVIRWRDGPPTRVGKCVVHYCDGYYQLTDVDADSIGWWSERKNVVAHFPIPERPAGEK